MGTPLEINALLVLDDGFDYGGLKESKEYEILKEGNRIYPFNIPLEFCDSNYKYLGKAVITKIELEKDETFLHFKVLKIFSEEESRVFTENFIKP